MGGKVCWPLGDWADNDDSEVCIAGRISIDDLSEGGMAYLRNADVVELFRLIGPGRLRAGGL